MAILGFLVALGFVFFSVQNRFNPAVLNFAPETDHVQTAPTDVPTDNVSIPLPAGIKEMSPAESFDPATLSNKINGKAELYLSAGFVRLNTQRFKPADDSSTWFEVFIYDMGKPSNAFAVYSSQRRQDVEKLSLTQHAYGTANALFFATGRHYVEIIAATSGEAVTSMLTVFAENFLDSVEGEAEGQGEAAGPEQVFPTEDLVADSITLIAKDAFGFDRLDQVYTAKYSGMKTETTLFVSLRSSPKAAEILATAYRDFLIEFGGSEMAKPEGFAREGFFAIDIMDAYEVVFSHGPYLAGVHMAEDKDSANRLATLLDRQIERVLDPRLDPELDPRRDPGQDKKEVEK